MALERTSPRGGFSSTYTTDIGMTHYDIHVAQGPGRWKPEMTVTLTPLKLVSDTRFGADVRNRKEITLKTFTQKGAAKAAVKQVRGPRR